MSGVDTISANQPTTHETSSMLDFITADNDSTTPVAEHNSNRDMTPPSPLRRQIHKTMCPNFATPTDPLKDSASHPPHVHLRREREEEQQQQGGQEDVFQTPSWTKTLATGTNSLLPVPEKEQEEVQPGSTQMSARIEWLDDEEYEEDTITVVDKRYQDSKAAHHCAEHARDTSKSLQTSTWQYAASPLPDDLVDLTSYGECNTKGTKICHRKFCAEDICEVHCAAETFNRVLQEIACKAGHSEAALRRAISLNEDGAECETNKESEAEVGSIPLDEEVLVQFISSDDEQKALPVLQMGDIAIVKQELDDSDTDIEDGRPLCLLLQLKKYQKHSSNEEEINVDSELAQEDVNPHCMPMNAGKVLSDKDEDDGWEEGEEWNHNSNSGHKDFTVKKVAKPLCPDPSCPQLGKQQSNWNNQDKKSSHQRLAP
ncbi:hypothetical protein GYMLUDRAFT_241062 [Collybiopsis luxurians FD-317 M1]|nr:hypothetical protein GYMLUDRAFT_241062 [Collybiopsis luxurians FD-317 M1]